jgi:hypothetical protein
MDTLVAISMYRQLESDAIKYWLTVITMHYVYVGDISRCDEFFGVPLYVIL